MAVKETTAPIFPQRSMIRQPSTNKTALGGLWSPLRKPQQHKARSSHIEKKRRHLAYPIPGPGLALLSSKKELLAKRVLLPGKEE